MKTLKKIVDVKTIGVQKCSTSVSFSKNNTSTHEIFFAHSQYDIYNIALNDILLFSFSSWLLGLFDPFNFYVFKSLISWTIEILK